MAVSPAHRFGQIIGEVVEAAMLPILEKFAKDHDLYLDKQGNRASRKGRKCSWVDKHGNSHDLDFVLERGGTPSKVGLPAAFIETAWRRYTKHSRNKAQEIQGAIMPLVDTYRNVAPFYGAVLAGVFTDGAITQLKSLGFSVLYFPYDSVVETFRKFDIEAAFDEKTPDEDFQREVDSFDKLGLDEKRALSEELVKANKGSVGEFTESLRSAVVRQVKEIIILPLHGESVILANVADAIDFIRGYDHSPKSVTFHRYEIQVRYDNGNRIEGRFQDKDSAIAFLKSFVLHEGTA